MYVHRCLEPEKKQTATYRHEVYRYTLTKRLCGKRFLSPRFQFRRRRRRFSSRTENRDHLLSRFYLSRCISHTLALGPKLHRLAVLRSEAGRRSLEPNVRCTIPKALRFGQYQGPARPLPRWRSPLVFPPPPLFPSF